MTTTERYHRLRDRADYWTVTDRSGTVYSFGRNQLPGWSSGKPVTNSVDSVPVYSAHPGDPCYNAAGFNSSVCTMAYKWHLDYVKNARGQAMSYWYTQDTNYYGQNQGASNTKYVRDSYLARIDYGFLDNGAFGTVPNQVQFLTGPRCVATTCDPISSSNAGTQYPDVPFDLICNSGTTCTSHWPSFFSTVRLKQIVTKQYSTATSQYTPVDTYNLVQTEPPTGDGTSPTLWLASVTRTASDTSAGGTGSITLPPVVFGGTTMQNRVDTANFPGMYRYRLTSVTSELGGLTQVTYGLPNPCTPAYTATANASTNTNSCYPVSWTPKFYTAPVTDWFQKYAVTSILETDQTGGAFARSTSYEYGGGAAWHYDDNEVVQPKYRTWGQFRGYADVTTRTGDGTRDRFTKSKTSYYRGMDGDWLSANSTRTVSLTDSQGASHTDSDQLSGMALESTAYKGDGGAVENLAITSYWVSPATATRSRTGLPSLTATAVKEAESYSRQAVTSTTPTTWRVSETNNSYISDPADTKFGLLTTTYSHTVPANAAYDQCTIYSYAAANTSLNLVGLVASQETDSVACGGFTEGSIASSPSGYNTLTAPATVNRPAQVQSATQTFYDDPTFSTTFPQAAAPTVGNVTMKRSASDYTGGAFTWQTGARTTYDTYGRPLVVKDANGNATTASYTVNAVGLTTAATVTNAKNQVAKSTIAPARGLTISATDANNITTTSQSDALGRLTGVWTQSRPTGDPANLKYSYTVSNTGLSGTTTDKLNDTLTYATSTTIYDSLGRVRQTQTPTPQDGRLITESFFDSRGWVSKTNTAFWDPDNRPAIALAANATDQLVPTQERATYDGLGRAVRVDSIKNNVVQESTTTVYGGDRTTVIPPAGGTAKTTVTDPMGRVVELDDYTARPTVTPPADTYTGTYTLSGGTSQAITYGFDGHGLQNTVTANGSTWTTTYNLLGQATGKNDPDAGVSTMQYDAVGNLIQSTDSRGKSTSTTYDALNRETATFASTIAAQSDTTRIASWVYDNDNNAVTGMTNPIGHTTTSTSYANGAAYETQAAGFNVFGESLGETVKIPAAEGTALGGKSYVYSHTYTGTGLPNTDTYPSGNGLPAETVLHTYRSAFDLPDSLASASYGYTQETTYDAWSRVLQSQIGSTTSYGIITNTYDVHTGRLNEQLVQRSNTGTPSAVDLQHYDYDQAGNTTRQVSTRLGATSETQCFTYDQLDRLTQAWTATDSCAATPTTTAHSQVGDAIPGGAYWTEWAFDALGNRTNQVEHSTTNGADAITTYSYNGNGKNQPHTLTSTSNSSTFAYDTAGNTTKRTTATGGTQTLTWDDANRLTSITGGTAGNSSYVYDADGQVLLQKDPGTTILYLPGQQYTLNTSTQAVTGTRYLALPGGGTLVRTGSLTNYRFEIADPHGTSSLVFDRTVQTPTWRQFTPYGAPRGTAATWPDNRGFLNAPTSTATSLTILGARQYDPTTGRFISLDPLFDATNAQQLGGYNYAASNPIAKSDPTGLRPDGVCGGHSICTSNELGSQGDQIIESWRPYQGGWNDFYWDPQKGEDKNHAYMTGNNVYLVYPEGTFRERLRAAFDIASYIPGLSIVGAIGGAIMDIQDGKYLDAAIGIASVIPGGKEVTSAGKVAQAINKTQKVLDEADKVESVIDTGVAVTCMIQNATHSFLPGTKVLLADGSSKPIEDVEVGDRVISTNPESGDTATESVDRTIRTPDDQEFTDLTFEASEESPEPSRDYTSNKITSTQHHPFWDVTTNKWTNAAELKVGDKVLRPDRRTLTVHSVANYHTAPRVAHDLTISNIHTYYILVGSAPILVHNVDPPCDETGLDWADSAADNFTYPGGTSGSLWIDQADAPIDLSSGQGNLVPGFQPPPGMLNANKNHAETQAAHMMHKWTVPGGIPVNATLFINNYPVCSSCRASLSTMIPTGSTLRVVYRLPSGPIKRKKFPIG
ncbi:polymorphic toxin-type HINT domain-containing protein [Kitasatospora phosalacinea]|uniref:Type IV secretion protein Rhs n=1 Tax=Kitasatospora phosalacinea TaxID=2065 RepID=A0A9W6PRH6_9ACTN|nr:polymorphic toxin-type HINT domain-containing protein [Kitasatospora phosalacinea]GLW59581.1 type IV secretion protein Rhs [Kitasatospora phosalacinea]